MYKRYGNRTVNNTHNISKTINQYTADVVNTYKINKVSNLKQAYYNLIDGVVINKHNTIYTNDNINVTTINRLVNSNDDNYFTKRIGNTHNINNNITIHNHNNYEHNVIK